MKSLQLWASAHGKDIFFALWTPLSVLAAGWFLIDSTMTGWRAANETLNAHIQSNDDATRDLIASTGAHITDSITVLRESTKEDIARIEAAVVKLEDAISSLDDDMRRAHELVQENKGAIAALETSISRLPVTAASHFYTPPGGEAWSFSGSGSWATVGGEPPVEITGAEILDYVGGRSVYRAPLPENWEGPLFIVPRTSSQGRIIWYPEVLEPLQPPNENDVGPN